MEFQVSEPSLQGRGEAPSSGAAAGAKGRGPEDPPPPETSKLSEKLEQGQIPTPPGAHTASGVLPAWVGASPSRIRTLTSQTYKLQQAQGEGGGVVPAAASQAGSQQTLWFCSGPTR